MASYNHLSLLLTRRVIALVVIGLLFASEAQRAPGQDLDSAVKSVVKFENKIERIQFQTEVLNGMLLDVNDLSRIDVSNRDPDLHNGDFVIFEPFTKRVRRESQATTKWVDGPVPYYSYDCTITYDGRRQRELCLENPGKQPPQNGITKGTGEITAESDYESKKRSKYIGDWMQPLRHFLPFIYGTKVSALLKGAKDKNALRLRETESGQWVFVVPAPVAVPGESLHIRFDPKRGAVVGAEWQITADGKQRVWKKLVFTMVKSENGFWFPERIDEINVDGKNITRQDFKHVRINQPVADDLFSVEFPLHTEVVDRVEGKRYVVGKGAVND